MNNPFYSWLINPRNVPGWVTPELEDKIVKAIKSGESQLKIAIRLTSETGREIQPYLIQYVSWKYKLSMPKKKISEEIKDLIKKLVSEGRLATEIAEQVYRDYSIKISITLIGKLGKEVGGLKNKVGKLTDEQALEMIIRVRTMEAERAKIERADLSRRKRYEALSQIEKMKDIADDYGVKRSYPGQLSRYWAKRGRLPGKQAPLKVSEEIRAKISEELQVGKKWFLIARDNGVSLSVVLKIAKELPKIEKNLKWDDVFWKNYNE